MAAFSKIIYVIGDPIAHSLTPALYSAAFQACELRDHACTKMLVKSWDLHATLADARALSVLGLAVTMPHKERALEHLDSIDTAAKEIRAVNTILNDSGKLRGFNTDWLGIIGALERDQALAGKRAAIIGAGGTARAAAYGLKQRAIKTAIFNRTVDRGESLAKEFNLDFIPLSEIARSAEFEILINTTPLAMQQESPIPAHLISAQQMVLDVVYTPFLTPLLQAAKQRGAKVVSGARMFLLQATQQFKILTGLDAPDAEMESFLLTHFGVQEL